jgi:predicted regulator of Ras-like GTPase activity (Roadblock/LC7/MglB family)
VKSSDLERLMLALRPAIQTFVDEARVRIALLINGSGQVLAQHGFTRSYEIVNVASLAAAAHASAQALAKLCGAGRWTHLYHAGRERQLFLAPLRTPAGELILVVIFTSDSSLGLVTLFYQQLEQQIAALPELHVARDSTDQAGFERDLHAGLELLAPERRR